MPPNMEEVRRVVAMFWALIGVLLICSALLAAHYFHIRRRIGRRSRARREEFENLMRTL